jgi:hypothetical protein
MVSQLVRPKGEGTAIFPKLGQYSPAAESLIERPVPFICQLSKPSDIADGQKSFIYINHIQNSNVFWWFIEMTSQSIKSEIAQSI